MKVKIPIRGHFTSDPLDCGFQEITLPKNYYRVLSGAAKPGDLYLDPCRFYHGEVRWVPLDIRWAEEMAKMHRDHSSRSANCVIRVGTPLGQPCDRCGMNPRWRDNRFCYQCCEIVREAIREQQQEGAG